jgi:hypothetical protein
MGHEDYKKFSNLIRDNFAEDRKLDSRQLQLTREISTLDKVRDLSVNKMFECEDVPNKVDKSLKEITGEDSECWFWTYSKGNELMNEFIVSKCVEVSNIKVDRDVLKARRDQLNKDQDALEEKLMEEFIAKQEESKETITA